MKKQNRDILKYILMVMIMINSINIVGQTPQWQWFKLGGGSGSIHSNLLDQQIKQIGTDARGNIYGISPVTSFMVTIDTMQPQSGFGYDDFVVFSLNCKGKLRWLKKFGTSGEDRPGGITVDNAGNVYVSGSVGTNIYCDAHYADSVIPANNYMLKSYFLEKLDSSGNVIYLSMPEPQVANSSAIPIRMESDNKGTPTVLTWFSDSTTWNGHHVAGRGHYIVKFNKADGSLDDIIELDFKFNNGAINYNGIFYTIDSENNIYINSNVLTDSLFIGNDTIPLIIDSLGATFIAKFNFNGNIIWHTDIISYNIMDSTQYIIGKPVICGGKVFITGNTYSTQSSNFLGIPVNNNIASNSYVTSEIIVSFNKNDGSFVNMNYLKNKETIFYTSLAEKNNKIILAGSSGSLIIMNQIDTIKPYTLDLISYPFIAEIDTNLSHFNWGIATKTISYNIMASMSSINVDHNGNIFLGGMLNGSITNSIGDTFNLVGGSDNFFVAKVALTDDSCGCNMPAATLNIIASSGNNLSIMGNATNMPDSVIINWGDGDSSVYSAMNTVVSHAYSNTGPWDVSLTAYSFCGNSSAKLSNLFSGVGSSGQKKISIFPNPFDNEIIIETNNPVYEGSFVTIHDITGKTIYKNLLTGSRTAINTTNLVKGFYFIRIENYDECLMVRKLVKD